ncbi:MAG: hypothetical protein CVU48_10390 [Candidatus Cloacimonetes bacterium HGW-Cloacimonetes-1]|jgi:hypothetical protein|nr:MAG: hypothetical protein CVU48_10390 [Candidatus Cloacimonetes bacterium HGW-Cloacimonetes-1]
MLSLNRRVVLSGSQIEFGKAKVSGLGVMFSEFLSSPDIVDKLCPSKRRRALLEGARRFDLTYAA